MGKRISRAAVLCLLVAGLAVASFAGTGSAAVYPLKCKVPKVKGDTVSQATTALKKNGCKLGKVTRRPGKGVKVGRVLKSTPSAGTSHTLNSKVNLLVRSR